MPIFYLLLILVQPNSLAQESATVDPACDRVSVTREPCDGRNVTEEDSCLALVILINNTRCPIKTLIYFFDFGHFLILWTLLDNFGHISEF